MKFFIIIIVLFFVGIVIVCVVGFYKIGLGCFGFCVGIIRCGDNNYVVSILLFVFMFLFCGFVICDIN